MVNKIQFIKVLLCGGLSACIDQSYVTVIDGTQERTVNKEEMPDVYIAMMQDFKQNHPDDHAALIKRVWERASALWENDKGITNYLCVDEDMEPVVMGAEERVVQAEAAREKAVVAPPIAVGVEPRDIKKCECNVMPSCYLKPVTPGNTSRVLNAKVRAFVRGGNLPGQGRCNNYCVSKLATTSLTAVDLAKSMAMARFL